ncbi:MAG: hypothetical protein E7161_00615 [Firmicutes bacterium]|nr:hypothetical protein [Bacillota bacterium]
MSKKEEFKDFIRNKPELVEYIKNKEMTMQKFYEIYDVYGNDENAWKPYERSNPNSTSSSGLSVSKITDLVKNINVDELQKHINTAQKALGIVEELTSKGTNNVSNLAKGPLTSRPLNKFFED